MHTRYLGLWVGLDVSPEQEAVLVIASIGKKLAFWSPLAVLMEDHSERCTEIFSNVASITGWYIWRERYRLALGG